MIGFVLISMANLMIGGSDARWQFQKQPVFIFLGLCIIGLSAGMITIPVLPEMLDAVEEDESLKTTYDMQIVENLISGMFVSVQSIGDAIGPIVSSYLTDTFSFQYSQEIYGGILAVFFILYFLFCGNFVMFSPDPIELQDDEEESEDKILMHDDL